MPHSGVIVRADRSGVVAVLCGAADIGQGSDSVLAYLVAEVLGIQPKDIRVHPADTDLTPVDLGSYSSRVTLMAGQAAIQAATRLRDRLFEAVAQKLDVPADRLVARDRRVHLEDDPERGVSFAEAVVLGESMHGVLACPGSYAPPRRAGKYKGGGVGPSPCYSYSACVVEAEVDEDTGGVRPLEIWIAHDVGRALNPLLVEGQVEGSVYMGLGEALMEEQVFRKGLHKIPSMLEYKSPTTLETPEIHTILVETDDPEGPFGAKEAGQGPLLPVMPAVANAVYSAVGVRIDEVPITPDKVLRALEQQRAGKPGRVGPEKLPRLVFPEPRADRVGLRPARPEGHREALRVMMRLPPFAYLAAASVADAVKLLAEHGPAAMPVAGGTDLYPNMKRRQFEPRVLVGLRAIRDLAGVRAAPGQGSDRRRRHHPDRGGAAPGRDRPLRGAGHRRRRRLHPAAPQHGHHRRQRPGRHAVQLLQPVPRVAQGHRLLHEEGRRHLPGGAGEPAVLGGVLLGHGPRALEPRGHRAPRGAGRGADRADRRPVPRRRHRVPGQAAGGDPDRDRPAARRWGALGVPEAPAPRRLRLSRAGRGGGPGHGRARWFAGPASSSARWPRSRERPSRRAGCSRASDSIPS